MAKLMSTSTAKRGNRKYSLSYGVYCCASLLLWLYTELCPNFRERTGRPTWTGWVFISKPMTFQLSVIGTDTYTLLRSLTAPRRPAELTYKELCDLLSSHFEPKPNAILQRYNFYSAYRKQGQSVKDFVAELKGLARNCDFGKTSTGVNLTEKLILEENLRDRLVCGVADTAIQLRLDLSFDKSFSVSSSYGVSCHKRGTAPH